METKTKAGCTTTSDDCLDCAVLDKLGESIPTCARPGGCGESTYTSTYCGNPFPGTSSSVLVSVLATPDLTSATGGMVPVVVSLSVIDLDDPNPTIRLSSIRASEPGEVGDVAQTGDVEGADIGTDDRSFSLKATNNGHGRRDYIVTYEVTDSKNNDVISEATVEID